MTEDIGFVRPGLSELLAQAGADIESKLPGADSRLRRSALSVLTHVAAGLAHGLYGALGYVARQVLIDRADTAHLDRWGASYGLARKPGARATGTVVITGGAGAVAPAGTVLERSDRAQYVTLVSAALLPAGTTVPVQANLAGLAGNVEAGTVLAVNVPIGSVSIATVTAGGLTGGADRERDESFRARLLDRLRQPPHGGNANDYVQWALELPGVTRVWVAPLEAGPGTVTLRFVMDETYPEGIPQAGDVAAVQATIDRPDRRPVTAAVEVLAPVPKPLNVTIAALAPNTPEVQAAVIAELRDLVRRERTPGGTIYLSTIWEAVAVATGERSHRILAPAADVTHAAGEIAMLGTVTFA
ncbi:MAG: baseplate J/gp47 family protein [Rhodospirillales bacterium]|nr:baseplate J/gp47 family protein [Rhodospirillales bacterium]